MYRERLSIAFSFVFSLVLVVSSIQLDKPAVDKNEKQIHFHAPKVSVGMIVPSSEDSAARVDERMFHISQFVESIAFPFHNPAGCALAAPSDLSPTSLLGNVQDQIIGDLDLQSRNIDYIWNAPLGSYVDISTDPNVYEFEINEFKPPYTYRADQMAAVFVQNGFAVWLRYYSGTFRILSVSMVLGGGESIWSEYVDAYWEWEGLPQDELIMPITKKLPCWWMVDENYVSLEAVEQVFDLDWQMPDYLSAGRAYLADSCSEAYQVSREMIGYWDATSVCGPLTWQINHDSQGFPYRIGSYDEQPDLFVHANPKYWGRRPWIGFDPQTYDLFRIDQDMAGYDFDVLGDLNSGDIIFSYGSPDQWARFGGYFSHIFMVAGLGENGSRLAITNLVKNHRGVENCSISEVVLYTPGEPDNGMIRYGWNDHGYGVTGRYGFDVFRWKWITYHLDGVEREYEVRWGDTVETIAFDWKVSPESILQANHFINGAQFEPGQVIVLPAPVLKE